MMKRKSQPTGGGGVENEPPVAEHVEDRKRTDTGIQAGKAIMGNEGDTVDADNDEKAQQEQERHVPLRNLLDGRIAEGRIEPIEVPQRQHIPDVADDDQDEPEGRFARDDATKERADIDGRKGSRAEEVGEEFKNDDDQQECERG